jgi:subtilase family serine protease
MRLWAGLAAGVLAVAVPVAAVVGAAQAASRPGSGHSESDQRQKVPTGLLATAITGAQAFGTTPPSTPERVSFILKERNLGALESAVSGGLDTFDSVNHFAASYGQTPAVVGALTGYLASFGIKTTVYPGNVDVSASGTAGEFNAALSVTEKQFRLPAERDRDGRKIPARTVYSATSAPDLPRSIGRYVLAVLGLTSYSPFTSQAVHVNSKLTERSRASATGAAPGYYLPSDFAANYGVTPLYKKASGAGTTIAIITLAALDKGAPQYFWSKVAGVPATGRTVSVASIDGGPGAPSDASGSGETDIDVEQSGGVAPGASVLVYQAPNTDPGFIDAFFAAASQNVADTVSSSWGESETYVAATVAAGQQTAAYEAAFDEVFLELAAQGQSAFVSSADAGAYTAAEDLSATNLSVDVPGDSPYVTSCGGTTTPWTGTLSNAAGTVSASVTVPRQRAWGWDYAWQAIATIDGESYAAAATSDVLGGGGGFSVIEPRPSYQRLVSGTADYHGVQYLTPTAYKVVEPGTDFVAPTSWSVDATPPLVSGTGSGRAEPDLSADADPFSGYLLYEPSAVAAGRDALEGGWGGTSFVAPQFNGSTAVIDSYLGHRIGLWNPELYALAAGPDSPVTPLNSAGTRNDNLFYTGNPGQQFNPATGLGVPNLAKFAGELAR